MELSIITIANNEEIYTEFLQSINTQSYSDYELITIFNYNNNKCKSARYEYNKASSKAKGDYLLFLHPDIRFNNYDALENIMNIVRNFGDFGVIGAAGAPDSHGGKRIIYTTILGGKEKELGPAVAINKPVEVQTVDECFFIVRHENFKKCYFSEKEGWHLYAVELCLQNIMIGNKNYVIPMNLWHMSSGASLDPNYVKQVYILEKEYAKCFPYIYTTVKRWKTRGIESKIYIIYYYIKQLIKKKLYHK